MLNDTDKIVHKKKALDMNVETFVNGKPLAKEVSKIVHEKKIDLRIVTAFEKDRLKHFFFIARTHEIIEATPPSIVLVKVAYVGNIEAILPCSLKRR